MPRKRNCRIQIGIVSAFLLRLGFAAFLLLLVSGCNKHQQMKVGILLHDMEGRWLTDTDLLKKFYAEAGVDVVLKVADGNERLQMQQVRELISEGVSAILIVPVNQNTAAEIVRYANRKNTPIIAYDRMVLNADLDYYISFEYVEVGAMIADYALQKKPQGNYVMLLGDASDANAQRLRQGQEERLKNSSANVLYKGYVANWSVENAAFLFERVFDFHPDSIDVVLASNDNIAQGVRAVLDKKGYSHEVIITGQDAVIESCRLIAQGKQSMSIYKSTIEMAKTAVDLTVVIIQDKPVSFPITSVFNGRNQVPSIFLKPQVVDVDNLMETVVADGFFSAEEIFDSLNNEL
jgi:D-xylose transport system substrate-binding protein